MWMTRPLAAAAGAALALALIAPTAHAGPYPTEKCVSAKLKAASTKCKSDLKAWAKWDTSQDNLKLNDALTKSNTKLGDAWTKAETKAAAKGADCTEISLSSGDEILAMDAAINDIKDEINATLVLPADGDCGSGRLKAAASKCQAFLKAESKYIKKLAKDPQGIDRDAALLAASNKFTAKYGGVSPCPAMPDAATIEAKIDALSDSVVSDTTTAPDIATTWTPVDPPAIVEYEDRELKPRCSRDTPYQYFVKRGTGADANKLLMYYQGGGACWDAVTCAPATGAFDDDVMPSDNPANTTTGLGDLSNVNNPFRNWSAVFISYCTGDVHWGDNDKLYLAGPPYGNQNIKHRGYQNAKVAEKWAREHFLTPTEVFVTGSSAGAYGAVLHGIFLHNVYPGATINVIGDAGNGVITQSFLVNNLEQSWSVEKNLPTYITGLNADITTLTIADLYGKAAAFYNSRGSRFGQYTTAWDGGPGSQTFFYNVMVNGIGDNANWWHSSCSWNSQMRAYDMSAESQAPSNYRYYIGPGSRHTIYGSNRVYTEIHGVPQTFVSWLNDMRGGGAWNNADCTLTDCSLLGSCAGGANAGASCQHDSECPSSTCNPIDVRPAPGTNPPNPFQADGYVVCPTPMPTSTP